jgi:hypothetical protein
MAGVREDAVVVVFAEERRLRITRDLVHRRRHADADIRIEERFRHACQRPCFLHPCDGHAQIVVMRDGVADQRLQRFILKTCHQGVSASDSGFCCSPASLNAAGGAISGVHSWARR